MVTRNFLFYLIVAIQLTSCNVVTKRSQTVDTKSKKEEAVPAEPVQGDAVKTKPKDKNIGLILGPGGMKAFAHIGVIKEFEKAKIPIKAVVGLEMGSLIGAFYAAAGNVNEAEWKLFKLREEDFSEKSFFQAKDRLPAVTNLLEFTKKELGSKIINDFRKVFGCISISMKDEKPLVTDSGNVVNTLKNCIPYPPLFKPSGERIAGATYVKEAADFLRLNGIDVVVLVNVLGSGKLMTDEELVNQPANGALWLQLRKDLAQSESFVDYVVSVDTKGMGIRDFELRRSMVQVGGNDGRYHVSILSSKYGF